MEYIYINEDLEPFSRASFDTQCCVRGQKDIAALPEVVFKACMSPDRKTWDKAIERVSVAHTIDMQHDVLHMVYSHGQHKSRDFCMLCCRRQTNDGSFIIACRSILFDAVPPIEVLRMFFR